MVRIATVADVRFRQRAAHLLRSLETSPNQFHLTVYCDDAGLFAALAGPQCDIVELPQMKSLGAKRTKLTAFAEALKAGSFIYLDADAIVLDSLDGMWGGTSIKGVLVDLKDGHKFVTDKTRPWPGNPSLVNRCYIMSGGFFAPVELLPLFERIRMESLNDATWRRYIAEGFLYDQHFFNALLNLYEAPIQPLDPSEYGWEGLLKRDTVQVYRSGRQLINIETGSTLRLVLFGGVEQNPPVLRSLPIDVAALIFERITPNIPGLDDALAQLYAALSFPLAQPSPEPFVKDILSHLVGEIPHLVKAYTSEIELAHRSSYFVNSDEMRSIACANPLSHCTWNGLQCGGAYLDANEYHRMRAYVRQLDIRSVLETGAGETSILLHGLGVSALSLEYQQGPWADRAAEHGCRLAFVPFDRRLRRFAEPELRKTLSDHSVSAVDLLFVDSPPGTRNRQNVLSQLLALVKPRYVLYHDAVRDAANIFRDQVRHGLKLIDFFDSPRGLVLFRLPSDVKAGMFAEQFDPATILPEQRTTVAFVRPWPGAVKPGEKFRPLVTLTNTSSATLSSRYARPVHIAYHWRSGDGQMLVWDGVRTVLPCDLEPGDAIECPLTVVAPPENGDYFLQVALVQEHVAWFECARPGAAELCVRVGVGS